MLEVKLPAAPGTVYPVPEGFVDNEVLTELSQPIMDAPILAASKLALQYPSRPRRGVSVVDLEKLSGGGPIRADMSRLMKVRSCNPARVDAAVGIMMANGRYAIPPALECDGTFLHETRNAAYLEFASAMLFVRPGGEDVGEIFPMAMLPSWWQFPLPGLPTTLYIATRVGHGVRQLFRAPVTHEEWLMYRDRACVANSVLRNKSRFIDLNPFMGEFGRTPGSLDGIQFSRNVFLPLPPSHRYFAVCSGSPSTRAYRTDSCLVRFERLAAADGSYILASPICIKYASAVPLWCWTVAILP